MTTIQQDAHQTLERINDAVIGKARAVMPDRDRILWAIGIKFARHPIYLLEYARTGEPKDLCRSEGGGMNYWYSRSKGVQFTKPMWKPCSNARENRLHEQNGCTNCRIKAGKGYSPEKQRDAIKKCKDPATFTTEVGLTVKWRDLARFIDPALADEDLMARVKAVMKRRYDHTANRGSIYPPSTAKTDEEKQAHWDKKAEHDRNWSAIEDEAHTVAAEVWDRALALSIMGKAMAGLAVA